MRKINFLRFNESKKGLTLPELLVSTAILAGALIATVFLLVNCMIANDTNRGMILAMNHAQYVMENIRNTTPFANISTNINNDTWDLDVSEITAAGLTALNNEAIETIVSGSTLLEITVTVTWKNRKQQWLVRSLTTLISQ